MANNFKMSIKKERENLHIQIRGDFDGMSAYQLLHVLKNHSRTCKRILINTGSLKEVHLFGKNLFRENLEFLNRQSCALSFTGRRASEFALDGLTET